VSADAVPQASEEIKQILRLRHRTEVGKDDFTLMTQQDILSITAQIMGVLTIFLGGIAAISLLVGGIGIMNIMLVSVTERTREIGLRKALGARKRDILLQFLTESATLSLFGGIVGILLGWGLAMIVGQIAAATGNDFTPVVGWDSVLLATLFSAGVGLFFGIYPSSRAAGLQSRRFGTSKPFTRETKKGRHPPSFFVPIERSLKKVIIQQSLGIETTGRLLKNYP
jgi:putative ABC transport system permease protein